MEENSKELFPANFAHASSSKGKDSQNRRSHKIKWEEEPSKPKNLPCKKTVHVRSRFGGQLQAYEIGDLELDIGDWVVVRQSDTTRLGLVTSKPIIWPANQGQKQLFLSEDRQILRVAAPEDLTRQAENQLLERDNYAYCQACVSNLSLSLKLVAVEITLDNFKTIFYYTSQERVDFRQLVRELVNRLRTRIEMRQIGTRQEALKLGGLGICGRPFCCSSFLSNFCQVSVRMAKEQNLSLNAAKISGVCGRLMCCLSFERYPKNVKSQNLPQDKAQEAALGADDPDIEERENYELTEGAVDYLEDHWARIEPSSEEPADLAVTEANSVASRKELQEDAREEPAEE